MNKTFFLYFHNFRRILENKTIKKNKHLTHSHQDSRGGRRGCVKAVHNYLVGFHSEAPKPLHAVHVVQHGVHFLGEAHSAAHVLQAMLGSLTQQHTGSNH